MPSSECMAAMIVLTQTPSIPAIFGECPSSSAWRALQPVCAFNSAELKGNFSSLPLGNEKYTFCSLPVVESFV